MRHNLFVCLCECDRKGNNILLDSPNRARKVVFFRAAKQLKKGSTKGWAHEAISDWIATDASLRKQLHQRDSSISQTFVHSLGSKKRYCVNDVERSPTNKELENDDNEHLQYSAFCFKTVFWVAATKRSSSNSSAGITRVIGGGWLVTAIHIRPSCHSNRHSRIALRRRLVVGV